MFKMAIVEGIGNGQKSRIRDIRFDGIRDVNSNSACPDIWSEMIGMKKCILILVLFIMMCPVLSHASEVDLPRTGQTTCYDEYGNVIDCTDTRQDGDVRAGVEWPSPRFVDNGDGTITDNLTGLIWLKNASCGGVSAWSNALNKCNNLASGSCGLSDGSVAGDWRLPNVVELESLINVEVAQPYVWLDNKGFSNLFDPSQTSNYWTATTLPYHQYTAFRVDMEDGGINVYDKASSWRGYTWSVRGGQTGPAATWKTGQTDTYGTGDDGDVRAGVEWPSPRFVDNEDGTITDNLTGLIWLKNAYCGGAQMTWQSAITYCNNLASGSCGLSDGSGPGTWRLPNRKELFSLIDFSRYHPALPQGHPFENVHSDAYWSATTYASDTANAWYVFMYRGVEGALFKDANHGSVWPVRGELVEPEPCSCPDSDGDGVPDSWDLCPDTKPSSATDSNGCAVRSRAVVIPLGE